MSIDRGSTPFVASGTFADKMVSNTLGFLLQGLIRYSGVGKHTLIVTKDEGGLIARYSHHK